MDQLNKLKADIEKWIVEWVSLYNSNLQAIPCPYAKTAMINNQVKFLFSNSYDDLATELNSINAMPLGIEVIAIGFDPTQISADQTVELVNAQNTKFKQCGLIALEDHPQLKEIVAGECMNNGIWGLVLIQSAEKLAEASQRLKKAGYYKQWTSEEFDQVVEWRWNF